MQTRTTQPLRWPKSYQPTLPLNVTLAAFAERLLPCILEIGEGAVVLDSVADFVHKRTGDGSEWRIEDPVERLRYKWTVAARTGPFLLQDVGFSGGGFQCYRRGQFRLFAAATDPSHWFDPRFAKFDCNIDRGALFAVGQALTSAIFGAPLRLPASARSVVFPRMGGEMPIDARRKFGLVEDIAERLFYLCAIMHRYGPLQWDQAWCETWSFVPRAAGEGVLLSSLEVEGVRYPQLDGRDDAPSAESGTAPDASTRIGP
jgi:hypothetical protein